MSASERSERQRTSEELGWVERVAVGFCVFVFFWPLWLMLVVGVGIILSLLGVLPHEWLDGNPS